jgi:hypothetical protein
MARPQELTKRLNERNRRTLATLPPHTAPTKPEDKLLEQRMELAKARLRRVTEELDGQLRVVTIAAGAGLALLRWRNAAADRRRQREVRRLEEERRRRRPKFLGLF